MELLYTILILPIEVSLRWVLEKSFDLTQNYGVSILMLSLVFNICLLPFYREADKLQRRERLAQKKMAPKLSEFRSVFFGQERYMMIRALYRHHGYHPVYALRAVVALLIQVPFFIAAYFLFDDYLPMDGHYWVFIRDLGQPDGLLSGFNLLPFVMTAINLAAGYVYTRGLGWREQVQILVIALIFLVLLYSSPSSLLLYWTLNNLFSLGKNIILNWHYGDGSEKALAALPVGSIEGRVI